MDDRATQAATAWFAASRIVDDAWQELSRAFYIQRQIGSGLTRLPDVSFAEAQRRGTVGHKLLTRLDELPAVELPRDLRLTLQLVRFRAQTWVREAEEYWTIIDPTGIGFVGLFLPTAYCGGWLLSGVHSELAAFSFGQSGDLDRYLGLIADYSRLIDQFSERTAGQAERGMWMPKAQVAQARALLQGLKQGARAALDVAPERLGALRAVHFRQELETRLVEQVEPAFDRALQGLSNDYLEQAPDAVGLGQYRDGARVYAELVRFHTTLDMDLQEIHALGTQRIAAIEAQMSALRAECAFAGNNAAFVAHLNTDAQWRVDTADEVAARFQLYLQRMERKFDALFDAAPRAGYGVAALSKALQKSMTFGFYDRAQGIYRFNADNLARNALFTVAALTYHELIPGHHLHLASQRENEALHPLRQHSSLMAYNEGWAEYAATLAGEAGLYEQPEERYGRLLMDAFLTSRLVVDTGLNALGWPLERATQYLREHSALSENEITSEVIRYSCDIPAQALAYKIGEIKILGLRERMSKALGPRFDLKEFHRLVLAPGALPLITLEDEIERVLASGEAR